MGGTGNLDRQRITIILLIAAWLFMCTVVMTMYGPVVGAFAPYIWMIVGLPFVAVGLTPLAPLGVIALFGLCVVISIQRIVTGRQILSGIHGLGVCAFLSLASMFPPSYA